MINDIIKMEAPQSNMEIEIEFGRSSKP